MKVLIAIDKSQCSMAALESVSARPWPAKTRFLLITVVEPALAQYAGFGVTGAYAVDAIVQAELDMLQLSQRFIDEEVTRLQSKGTSSGITVEGKVLQGNVADCVIDEIKEWQPDLLIVGSHGRTGLTKFLLGSVAQKLASHAPCSIEIIKTPWQIA